MKKLYQQQVPSLNFFQKLHGQLRLSTVMQLSERELEGVIYEIEKDPFFKKLMYPKKGDALKRKIISRSCFNRHAADVFFGELYENTVSGSLSPEFESVCQAHQGAVEAVRRIGIDTFKKYFLYNDFDIGFFEFSKMYGVSESEIEQILDFVNDIFLKERFYSGSQASSLGSFYFKIASIEKNNASYSIVFTSLNLSRGIYVIDYDGLKDVFESGVFSKRQLQHIHSLISRLTLINMRKSTIYNVLNFIISRQKSYLDSKDKKDLIPLSQKEAAREFLVSPSIISRLIQEKSIETPWGEEKPLKYFFPTAKIVRLNKLEFFINEMSGRRTDKEIRDELALKHGIYVARRTISKYRNELSLPPLRKK